MLDYNEIREKKIIIYNGEPAEVVESHVARTQQRKPQNQVKLKSLISGKTIATTFHASESAEEADIEKKEIKYLYNNRGEFWFCDIDNPKNRFSLPEEVIGASAKFFKDNTVVTASIWNNGDDTSTGSVQGKVIQVSLPVKMEFIVKEAPPSIKGNTAQGGNKVVTLETGATINTPMFIETGDKLIVNTETGEYVERAK